MPIKASARKALRQSKKRAVRNLAKKNAVKDIIKKIKKMAAQKKHEEAKKLVPLAYKAIDKAVKTGVIKKNTASRKKSQLIKSLRATS